MSDNTKIEWADATWNPVTGCTRVSPGCEHCYIDWAPPFRIEGRHFVDAQGERSHAIGSTTGVRVHPGRLDRPLRWKRPRRIFVNSLSDLFHDDVSDAYIARAWAVMALAPQHTFQVLTKRHGRMRALLRSLDFMGAVAEGFRAGHPAGPSGTFDEAPALPWPLPNVWVGVTVEDQERADLRVPYLLATPAAVRFLSCEPLLGPVTLHQDRLGGRLFLDGIDWVIAGGESGPDARPMHPDWARSLRDQCTATGVPFLFKQWGEWVTEDQAPEDITLPGISWSHLGDGGPSVYKVGKRKASRELDGRTWDEYPATSSQAGGES